MPNGFSWESEPTWGHAGPYTWQYATFESYVAPITVTVDGRSKIVYAEGTHPEYGFGPCDQDVERAVIAAVNELIALPVSWKKYLVWIPLAGMMALGIYLAFKKKK